MNKPKYKELYKEALEEKERAEYRFENLINVLKQAGIKLEDKKTPSQYGFFRTRYISVENNGKKVWIAYPED